jgi:uncharacterized membrane protein YqiK
LDIIVILKWVTFAIAFGAFIFFLPKFIIGLVVIPEDEIGIVIKKFSSKKLPADRFIALNGEAGYQADTLGPGWHLGFFPWQYTVEKENMIEIAAGEIGLLIARDGDPIPQNRILAQVVQCDNFQDARKFLTNRGQKGRQTGILTAGRYRINTELFEIVTKENAKDYGLKSEELLVYSLPSSLIGIVTALDGEPITTGEIAGQTVEGHDNFQNTQAFIAKGGRRGLQEQVLLSGTWNLNPWFVKIEQVPMTEIPIGNVGVVNSYVGLAHADISGDEFKHGDLVEKGHKGVWQETLSPGKYPLNLKTMKVEVVPTTNLALNWATNRSESHKLDEKLSSITVRSKDGFSFTLDVAQIIHIGAKEASRVISRFGSMKNLVDQVLEPAIGNYFRNSVQEYSVLDFLSHRVERQTEAAGYIGKALKEYNVEAVDTLIGDINPPEALIKTQTEKKMAEELKNTYEVQEAAQKQRQTLVREQALADTQPSIVAAERDVAITKLKAQSAINEADGISQSISLRAKGEAEAMKLKGEGEAEAIRKVGEAKAAAYKAGVDAMGEDYATLQVMNVIGDRNVKLIPDTLIQGGEAGGMLLTGILSDIFKNRTKRTNGAAGKVVMKTAELPEGHA